MSAPTLDNPSLSWTNCSKASALSTCASALASAWNSAQALAAVSNTVAASKNRPADPSRTSCSASMIARRARARDATPHCSRLFICAVAAASSLMPPHARRTPSSIAPSGRSYWDPREGLVSIESWINCSAIASASGAYLPLATTSASRSSRAWLAAEFGSRDWTLSAKLDSCTWSLWPAAPDLATPARCAPCSAFSVACVRPSPAAAAEDKFLSSILIVVVHVHPKAEGQSLTQIIDRSDAES